MRRLSVRAFTILALAVAVGLALRWPRSRPRLRTASSKVVGGPGRSPTARRSVQRDSPIPAYAFPGIENDRLAKGVAGFAGTLGVFVRGIRLCPDAPAAGPGRSLSCERCPAPTASSSPASPVTSTGPVHRLDPRAKVVGAGGGHARGRVHPARARGRHGARAPPCSRRWPVSARVQPGGDLRRRARAPLLLVLAVAVTLPFVRTGGQTWALGPLTLHEAGSRYSPRWRPGRAIGTLSAVLLMATTTLPEVLRGAGAHAGAAPVRADRGPHVPVPVRARGEAARMKAALAARDYRPRSALHAGAAGRVAGGDVPAHARARGARAPGHGGPRLLAARCRGRAAPARPRRTSLFLALVLGALLCRAGAGGAARHELRDPRPRPALPLPGRARRRCAGVDLHVAHGERIALLGANGAGKTTLMLHLNGLLRGSGALEVAGLAVERRQPAASCAPGSGWCSRIPTTSCSCPPCARTWPSGR